MGYALGIDMGGTKISGALVNSRGSVIRKSRADTQSDKPLKVILKNLCSVIDELMDSDVDGIGIGLPGSVFEKGPLGRNANIPQLDGFDLRAFLKRRYRLPVVLENDANCFALAEAMFGTGKGDDVVVGIIWGTGLGGGIVIGRKVFRGAHGLASEPGHAFLDGRGKVRCGCGKVGDLESFTSGPKIVEYYHVFGGKKELTTKQVFSSREKAAKRAVDQAVDYLAKGVGMIVATLDPDVVVVGGGVSNNGKVSELNKLAQKYAPRAMRGRFKVVKHTLGDDSGMIGAAALVLSR